MSDQTKVCKWCGKNRLLKYYLKNKANKDGYFDVCNLCKNKIETKEEFELFILENGIEFDKKMWKKAEDEIIKELKKKNKGLLPSQNKIINKTINKYISLGNLKQFEHKKNNKVKLNKEKDNYEIDEDLVRKWGEGFKYNDYLVLEEKYERYCRSFNVENEAQNDYLKKACVASLKVDQAMANGEPKEVETWMKVYDTAMKSGKLQPVQMSAADMLSGVVTFSQFFELVEKSGFIPPMPHIIRDDIDYAIWRFINYNRELMDLPPIELGEVKDIMTYDYISGQEILEPKEDVKEGSDN